MKTVLCKGHTATTQSRKKTILLVEDHALLRAGMRTLLAQEPDLEIVGEASNGRDAMRSLQTFIPDLILMDLSMRGTNGIDAIRAIKRRYPSIAILVVTMHNTEEYIHESLKAGADGYMLKDASHGELCEAVHSVLEGKTYLSPDISEPLLSAYRGEGGCSPGRRLWELLTRREREVLKLIGEGYTNQAAAAYLYLSVGTVEKHRSNLMRKLGMKNVAKLTAFAIQRGIVSN